MRIVILGLSITSSWGNGHATTYRGLMRELCALGHEVTFLERDVPWYANSRDLAQPPFGRTELYANLDELRDCFADEIESADFVIVGSYVPEGVAVGEWVLKTARGATAFYDIDTPVTLAKLARGDYEYLAPHLISQYDVYLSFSGGKTLRVLEDSWGSPCARPLYCSVDPELYFPEDVSRKYDLSYLGTYSDDRQPGVERLLLEPSRQWNEGRFAVAGPQYPPEITWPYNVRRIEHLPPSEHRAFYNASRWTLNITRADMIQMGHSPSVRLFEAAACATPIVSDWWEGLDEFFTPGTEICIAHSTEEALRLLRQMPDDERYEMGRRARHRVLDKHTARHRATVLEGYAREAFNRKVSR